MSCRRLADVEGVAEIRLEPFVPHDAGIPTAKTADQPQAKLDIALRL